MPELDKVRVLICNKGRFSLSKIACHPRARFTKITKLLSWFLIDTSSLKKVYWKSKIVKVELGNSQPWRQLAPWWKTANLTSKNVQHWEWSASPGRVQGLEELAAPQPNHIRNSSLDRSLKRAKQNVSEKVEFSTQTSKTKKEKIILSTTKAQARFVLSKCMPLL